jgi:6-pyruvoyltetrahydropterin/6-carboxytetrahydropterin synthase
MTGIFEVYVKTEFSAAHSLAGYPGDCARVHGHNWQIEVYVRCRDLDRLGMAIDFMEIKKAVQNVLRSLDHFNLNELAPFREVNPTSENIAKFLYKELSGKLNFAGVTISKVKVAETPEAGAAYWEE